MTYSRTQSSGKEYYSAVHIIKEQTSIIRNWVYYRLHPWGPIAPDDKNVIPLYWWDQFPNFGDQLGPWVVHRLTGLDTRNTWGNSHGSALVTVGSVVHCLNRPGLNVWGSGLIEPITSSLRRRLLFTRPNRVSAVRGSLTRNELQQRLGWDIPPVYGDPALLVPYLLESSDYQRDQAISIVPHYLHFDVFSSCLLNTSPEILVDVRKKPEEVVRKIANSKVVLSSSLHGLILAQAFRIPWVWLKFVDDSQHGQGYRLAGDDFKFEDFFTTVSRKDVVSVTIHKEELADLSMDTIADKATLPDLTISLSDLIDAFPLPLSPEATRLLDRL